PFVRHGRVVALPSDIGSRSCQEVIVKRFEDRISIDAPAGQVFDYVSDFPRHAEWSGNGLQVTKTTEGPVAVGTLFSTTAKQFGTQREQSTVTELSPGSAFAWESKGALGLARHRFSLSGDGGSTTLTKSAEIVEPTFLAKLTSWKLSKDIPAGLHRDLAKIKAHLERRSPS
ncbi:MAG: SRPBCC family protein, partial [Actinomycetota bacterium]